MLAIFDGQGHQTDLPHPRHHPAGQIKQQEEGGSGFATNMGCATSIKLRKNEVPANSPLPIAAKHSVPSACVRRLGFQKAGRALQYQSGLIAVPWCLGPFVQFSLMHVRHYDTCRPDIDHAVLVVLAASWNLLPMDDPRPVAFRVGACVAEGEEGAREAMLDSCGLWLLLRTILFCQMCLHRRRAFMLYTACNVLATWCLLQDKRACLVAFSISHLQMIYFSWQCQLPPRGIHASAYQHAC